MRSIQHVSCAINTGRLFALHPNVFSNSVRCLQTRICSFSSTIFKFSRCGKKILAYLCVIHAFMCLHNKSSLHPPNMCMLFRVWLQTNEPIHISFPSLVSIVADRHTHTHTHAANRRNIFMRACQVYADVKRDCSYHLCSHCIFFYIHTHIYTHTYIYAIYA